MVLRKEKEVSIGGDAVDMHCNIGFEFHLDIFHMQRRSLVCLQAGQWHTFRPECIPVTCEIVLPHGEGKVQIGHGQQFIYTCPLGTVATNGRGNQTTYCNSDGALIYHLSPCAVNNCGALPYIDFGQALRYENSLHKSNATLQCNPGYRFPSGLQEMILTCVDGEWISDNELICEEKLCSLMNDEGYGSINTTKLLIGTYVLLKCFDGYMFPEETIETIRHCDELGEWSKNISISHCQEVKCRKLVPNDFPNGTILQPTSVTYNSKVTITCLNSMRFPDGSELTVITCNGTGYWHPMPGACDVGRCGSLKDESLPQNTIYDGLDASEGSIVTYQCEQGFAFSDSQSQHTVECTEGNWIGIKPSLMCRRQYCTSPSFNSFQRLNDSPKGKYALDTTISYTCETGYVFESKSKDTIRNTTCIDGTWESFDNCTAVQCPLNVPTFSKVLTTRTHILYNETIVIMSIKGYWLSKDVFQRKHTCRDDGNWEPLMHAKSHVVRCQSIALLEGYTANDTSMEFGVYVNYSCNKGFYFVNGDSWGVTLCSKNGSWSPHLMACTELKIVIPPKEAEASALLGTVAASFVCLLFCLIIVSDMPALFLGILTGVDNIFSTRFSAQKKEVVPKGYVSPKCRRIENNFHKSDDDKDVVSLIDPEDIEEITLKD